ncbi:MAG: DUF3025 domain-containing protein [Psychrobacter sp.]|nr:DUF3025 domain-containing protein [Psychrobacter sp.]
MTAYDATIEPSIFIRAILDTSFAPIDWQAPWLAHLNQLSYLRATIEQLSDANTANAHRADYARSDAQIDIIANVLNTALQQQSEDYQTPLPITKPVEDNQAHRLKFISQNALPEGVGYEQFIGSTGKIPTRDNLHDLFNGSIWLTFPKTKALLNYHHMLEIAACHEDGRGARRGRVRDTITVFDENGAILVTADPSIGEALIDFDWQASLVVPRARFDDPNFVNKELLMPDAQAAVYIFGHALLEQLIQPRKPLCAHSVIINVAAEFFALSSSERIAYLDNQLAIYMDKLLSQHDITPRQLAPLPILGVPHFWSENADPSFYDDAYVFRSGRRK